jgi:redox-sensitive bicupin YhaK (pirin superfamily)
MGSAFGAESPVATYSPTLYFEARMPRGATLVLPAEVSERAAYVVSGAVRIDGREHREGVLAVARTGASPSLTAVEDSRVMVIGGEPVGPRHIWWNYVSSSKERIERAKRDWVEGRIGKVPGDDEFIPLPDR